MIEPASVSPSVFNRRALAHLHLTLTDVCVPWRQGKPAAMIGKNTPGSFVEVSPDPAMDLDDLTRLIITPMIEAVAESMAESGRTVTIHKPPRGPGSMRSVDQWRGLASRTVFLPNDRVHFTGLWRPEHWLDLECM